MWNRLVNRLTHFFVFKYSLNYMERSDEGKERRKVEEKWGPGRTNKQQTKYEEIV